ncbi:hypothetical protein ABBQ38_004611 [Trebouxia sp. C0009 RCD-2024]
MLPVQDHATVTNYPKVQGMVHDVFFWSHDHPEGGKDENASKQNGKEAAMAARLAFYLVQQGYDGGDITILTPYVGQLLLLRTEIRKYMRFVVSDKDAEQLAALQGDEDQDDAQSSANASTVPPSTGQQAGVYGCGSSLLNLATPMLANGQSAPNRHRSAAPAPTSGISQVSLKDSVRVATVDNFQGEESTIVILSLVRNNKDGSIGFLKTSNRVNVMLSRAKHGMYILGHAETLTANKKSNMWHEVLDMLEDNDAIGESLPVVCVNHPNQVTQIRAARDFDTFVRDGGCSLQCTARMPCGHTCPRMCHPDDPRHLALECMKPCTHELQPCGHPCQKLCYERAQAPDEVICSEAVTVKLSQCNHTIDVKCGEVAAVQAASTCNAGRHAAEPCCAAMSVAKPAMAAPHAPPASGLALHSACMGTAEACAPTHAPPVLSPASGTANIEASACCPAGLLATDSHVTSAAVYDIYEDMQKPLREYEEAALLTDPLVILTCGHVFPMSSMDGFTDLDAAYAKDSSGKWTKPRSVTAEQAERQPLKSCPLCRQPLGQIRRYGRCLNRMKIDHAEVKFFVYCSRLLLEADNLCKSAKHSASSILNRPAVNSSSRARKPTNPTQDATVRGLQHAANLAYQSTVAYSEVQRARSPTLAVFQNTRNVLRRLQEQHALGAGSCAPGALASLEVPKPDVGPKCKALIGMCQARTVWMATCTGTMQRVGELSKQGSSSSVHARQMAVEVRQLWSDASEGYRTGLSHARQAIKLATDSHAVLTKVQAGAALVSLQQQRVRDLSSSQATVMQNLQGTRFQSQGAVSKQQLALLDEAQEACHAAKATLGWSGLKSDDRGASLASHLDSLMANFDTLNKLVDLRPTPEEMKTIMAALMKGNADLAGPGFTGQGHFYKCPNGHPYVIGDCGGANQTSVCPECRAGIGGSQHRLAAGNAASTDLQALASASVHDA